MAAYHAGEFTEEGEGQIQDHLTICEECARLLLSLSEFEQYRPEPEPAGGEDSSAAAWLRFRERLHEEEGAAAPAQEQQETRTAVLPLQRRRVPLWQRPLVAWAAAAVFALCVVGLEMRMGSLREENRRLITPPALSPVAELFSGSERGADDNVEEILGTNPLLILHLPDPDKVEPKYDVEVVSASDGKPITPRVRLALDGDAVHLNLTHQPLPTGDYVARVFGLGEGRPLVGEYRFRLLLAAK